MNKIAYALMLVGFDLKSKNIFSVQSSSVTR